MPVTQRKPAAPRKSATRKSATRTTEARARKSTTTSTRSAARGRTKTAQPAKSSDTFTVTIPVDQIAHAAVNAATAPLAMARRVLPAKGGLPIYLGIGALAVAEIIEWPIAVTAGVGYAVLRQWGPAPLRAALSSPAKNPKTSKNREKQPKA